MKIKIGLLFFCLFFFLACPDPHKPEEINTDPGVYLETEFLYDVTFSGSMSYSLDGTDYSADVSEVDVHAGYDDQYPGGSKLMVDIFFEDVMAAVNLKLSYNPDGEPEYWVSVNQDGNERFWVCLFETPDHYFYKQLSSSGWDFDYTVTPEKTKKYYIDKIEVSFDSTAVIPGDYAITITHFNVLLDLSKTGYLLLDNTSGTSIDELRHYDTSSILSTVTTDVFANPEQNLLPLVEELTAGSGDPLMQVRVIHDWICSNIYYDNEALAGIVVADEQPLDVLSSRRAVCEGLSLLMQKMCRLAGIDARIIYGRVQGQSEGSGHAWNALKVNGDYYLLDLTFGDRNFYDSDPETPPAESWIEGGFRSNYFLLDPGRFIESHYPWADVHQFLEDPVTEPEFNALSLHSTLVSAVYNHYHRLEISLDSPISPVYTIASTPHEWTFYLPDGYNLEYFIRSVSDLDDSITENLTGISFLQKDGTDWTLSVLPAEENSYWLYLKANNQIDDDVYIAIFFLEKTGNEPASQTLPLQVMPDYTDYQMELLSPFKGTIYCGNSYDFSVYTGEADITNIILYQYESISPPVYVSSNFTGSSPGLWELTMEIPEGIVQCNVNIVVEGLPSSITVLKYKLL